MSGRAARHGRALLAGALALGMLQPVAAAQAQAPTTTLRLVAQKLVLAPEEPLTATLAVSGNLPPDAELTVTASSRLRPAREGLHALLDDGAEPGGTVDFLAMPVSTVPRDAAGRLSVIVPTVRRSADNRRDTLRLSAPGLYPLTFELRTAQDDPLASLLTFVERTDDAVPVVPMSVALATEIDSPPARQPDGSIRLDEQAMTDLTNLVAALEHNPKVPATVSLPPELLDRLATSATPEDVELVQQLGTVLAGRQVLARPYVSMNPSSSAASELSVDYTRLLAQGEDALRQLFPGITPDRTLFLGTGTLDGAGLQLLRNLGTLNVVLGPAPEDDSADRRAGVDTTHTVQLADDGVAVRAEVLDAAVLRRITATPDPVLAAHYLAVELLTIQGEQPEQAGRGMVVLPPAGWPVDPVFLGTLEDLLGQIPQLHPVSLGALFAATSAAVDPGTGGPATLPPPGGEVPDRRALAAQVEQRRAGVRNVGSMLPAGDPMPGELRQLLDLSLAEDITIETRLPYLSTVDAQLGAVTNSIVPMDRRQFTITSKRTTIPISVRTTWPEPLKVKVRLSSPKLDFPNGDEVVTVTASSPPFRVPVEAKTNGTFQVTASLLTPEGDAPLGPPMALTVRSTALSGLGILVTIAAAQDHADC
jgi:hypothetical protein